ncbi:hypothetical protein ACVJBD_005562 [Rhizobium mongolense]
MKVLRSSGGPPRDTHAELDQHRVLDQAFFGKLFGEPEMAGIERLDFWPHTEIGHLFRHRAQHAWRIGHDIVAETEVHGAAVERADFRQAFADMADALAGARHVGPFWVQGQWRFDIAENQVAAHAGRQIEHDIDFGGADAIGDFPVEVVAPACGTGVRITDMAVNDCRPSLGGVDRGIRDLLGSNGNVA